MSSDADSGASPVSPRTVASTRGRSSGAAGPGLRSTTAALAIASGAGPAAHGGPTHTRSDATTAMDIAWSLDSHATVRPPDGERVAGPADSEVELRRLVDGRAGRDRDRHSGGRRGRCHARYEQRDRADDGEPRHSHPVATSCWPCLEPDRVNRRYRVGQDHRTGEWACHQGHAGRCGACTPQVSVTRTDRDTDARPGPPARVPACLALRHHDEVDRRALRSRAAPDIRTVDRLVAMLPGTAASAARGVAKERNPIDG